MPLQNFTFRRIRFAFETAIVRSPDRRDPAGDHDAVTHDDRESQIDRIDRDQENRGYENDEGNGALPSHLWRHGDCGPRLVT